MTVPYTSGTITLVKGSAQVLGIDTAWKAALIVGGIIFVNVPNVGAMSLPVATVDSNTDITAAIPWEGANGTYSYALVRDGSFERQATENAIKLASLLDEMRSQALSELSVLTPAADKLPYFGAGGAGALADFNAAARALLAGTGVLPNAQLPTRLKSLVTPVADLNTINETGWSGAFDTSTNVPIAGFYLVHTQVWVDGAYAVQFAYSLFNTEAAFRRHKVNGVWGPWKASGQVTVGTVSQASGLPLGAIIERGGNGNGQYTRFADGTQICNHFVVMNGLDNKRLYRGWQFPAIFSAPPYISPGIDLTSFIAAGFPISNGGSIGYASSVDLTSSSVTMSIETNYAGMASGINVVGLYATAIGRWY